MTVPQRGQLFVRGRFIETIDRVAGIDKALELDGEVWAKLSGSFESGQLLFSAGACWLKGAWVEEGLDKRSTLSLSRALTASPQSVADLAGEVELSKSYTRRLLKGLERDGYSKKVKKGWVSR